MSRFTNLRNFVTSAKRVLDIEANTLDSRLYTDFKKHLKNNKIQYKDGPTCLHVECRMCAGGTAATAYVNKRTGVVLCPPCDVKKPLAESFKIYEKQLAIDKEDICRDPYVSRLTDPEPLTQDICDLLRIKGLKLSDFKGLNVKYSREENSLYFPLLNAANIVVGEQVYRLTDNVEETYQNANNSGLLVHGSACLSKAILVNSIRDFVVLLTQRSDQYAIVCLPYGLKTLPLESLPALEAYKELILWFKLDSTGWDAAKTYANKLDEKRCLLIRPTDTEPSPYESVRRGLFIRQVLQKAMPVRHKSITTFNALRNDILSELQNIEKVNGVKWKRFPVLNKLLHGHRKGELTIITGPTGSGKTTFMCEYSLDLALQGVSTLWGSFEIRNSRLASTLLRQFVGYSLEKKLHEFDYWANEFEKYPLYFMTFHGQQPLKVVMEAIEHAHYVHDINHVIIDNLQFMMGLSQSYRTDKFWEQDAIIAAFRALATKHNVHVTLVMHPRKERDEDDLTTSSIFGSAKASQEADNVLIIQDKRLTSVRGKKYLQIVKNRYSGDLGIMPLEFNKESLSYCGDKKKKDTAK